MKRVRIFAVLLCTFALTLPLTGLSAAEDSECSGGYCSSHEDCGEDGFCLKRPGQGCGICA